MAIMAALVRRATTGEGAYLDVSITDGVVSLMALYVDEYLATGTVPGPGHYILTGRYACYDTYRCADDRWVTVGAIEPAFYRNLCRLLDCERWADHQLDDDVQDEMRADFAAAFACKPRDEWVAELAPADTCVGPVYTVPELVDDPQIAARGLIGEAARTLDDGSTTSFRQLGTLLAGTDTGRQPVRGPGGGHHRHRRAAGRRRSDRRRDRGAAERGAWSRDSHRHPVRRAARGRGRAASARCSTPRPASSPSSRATSGRAARRSRTATRCSGTTPSRRRVTDGPIAPPSTLSVWFRPHNWSPGRTEPAVPLQVHFDLKARFDLPEAVMTDNTIVFHEPVRPGDTLRTHQVLRSVSPPKTTKLGTGRFWVIEVEYFNQRDELVGVESYTGFGYRRDS